MRQFIKHRGIAAPLLEPNIDTDIIIPSREMKRVSKEGLGEGAFANRRYTLPGGRDPNPDFVLNQAAYKDASIILAGANFGCGSSREHAVWALTDLGIRAVIAPGFGHIFYNNCFSSGLLPLILGAAEIAEIAAATESDPQRRQVEIDLENCEVAVGDKRFSFTIEAANRDMLLNGLDRIGQTLLLADEITAFESADRARRGWAYID